LSTIEEASVAARFKHNLCTSFQLLNSFANAKGRRITRAWLRKVKATTAQSIFEANGRRTKQPSRAKMRTTMVDSSSAGAEEVNKVRIGMSGGEGRGVNGEAE